jgi:prevent-host-death family protein
MAEPYRTSGVDPGRRAVNTAPLSEVRDKLREVVDTVVETGTEYVITRHGRPVAVVLSFDEYESLVESLNILSDDEAMAAIVEGEEELGKAG